MQPITESSKEFESLFEGWFKNILGISTGALAVLASLLPTADLPCPDKYFLASCWLLLVVCILSSLVASLRRILLAHLGLQLNLAALDKQSSPGKTQIKRGWLTPMQKMKAIVLCQYIAIVSFCLAFISLAIYAFLRTVGHS